MSTPRWIIDLGLEDPSIDEFLRRPDLRQIASFFLGILFAAATYYFFHSSTLRSVRDRLTSRRPSRTSIEAIYVDAASKSTFSSLETRLDPLALVFIMDLVYITTAATQFASLLAFSSTKGQVPCTFFVAWATLGGETIRLIAFLKLSFHLYELRPSKFERAMLWSMLSLLAVIMFLNTAVATGVLRILPQVESFALCYRRHFTLGAAIIGGVNVILEFYFLIRIIFLLLPWSVISSGGTLLVKDVRVHRALSLLILDGATIYPSLFPTSIVADFAPFAMSSILVLIAFNHNPPPKPSPSLISTLNIAPPSLRTLPQSIRIPTPNFSPFLNMESSVSASKERSIIDIPPDTGSVISIATRGTRASKTTQHPFAVAVTESQAPNNMAQRRVLLRARSMPPDAPGSPVNGGSRTRFNLFNSQNVQRRVTAYEAFLGGTEEDPMGLENGEHRRDSFLPSIPTTPQETTGSSARVLQRPQRTRSSNVRGPRQILPRQTEVADRMVSRPHFTRPSHQAVTSLSSIQSSDNPAVTSPPAPPRVQRLVTQTPHQILVSTEDPIPPVTPRSSSPDSTKLFGSDILLRSREDIMRNPPPASSEDVNGGSSSILERERVASQQGTGANHRDSSQVSIITGGRPRTADSARPTTADSVQSRDDSIFIPREPSASTGRLSGGIPLSKRALNALKRPTFGEASFERFKTGLTSFTEIPPSNSAKDEDSPTGNGPRDERKQRTSGSSSRLLPTREHSGSKGDSSRSHSQQGTGI